MRFGVSEIRGALLGVLIGRASYYVGVYMLGAPYCRKLPLAGRTSRSSTNFSRPGLSPMDSAPRFNWGRFVGPTYILVRLNPKPQTLNPIRGLRGI